MQWSNNQKQLITFAVATLALVQMAQAQRPSFAGIRPPGLNQKDKYNVNNNVNNYNNNSNSNIDIVNRFGQGEEVAKLPHGATQKPPANYVPVVFPESNYLPLATPSAKPVNDFIANRFGGSGSDESVNKSVNSIESGGAALKPVSANGSAAAAGGVGNIANRLPIDAKDDRELVAILSRLPADQQPFWFVNAAAIEAQRNGSYPNFAGAVNSRGSFFG
ncbi:uncharacterized protein LOC101451300 [Ceratitis capitata]|uniref:(Mediterranean fruit fly) hypothetical protein n=1 Tax=Ceratitis capitata TaxID=7213 RepID=W8B8W7_CERCA|nr:uncharacterized protein LOC101451300 [Ceratitis capitata]CAD7005156.1 unnamed protein product [Ceratitis capitata]